MPLPKALLLCCIIIHGSALAQTMPEFQSFTYTSAVSWNTSNYQSFQYNIPDIGTVMRFRLMTPNGFSRTAVDGKQYPIIIFLHGSGEAGVLRCITQQWCW